MFDSQKHGVEDDTQHDEQVEHGIVHDYVQHGLELEPGVVADATFPTLGTVSVHELIVVCSTRGQRKDGHHPSSHSRVIIR